MPLTTGTRLGVYEVTGVLGAGGMGEVYRARDSSLNRSVAIKVLPELFALDAERLARFTREAQTLAALNHPNIAQIYGLEGNDAPGRPARPGDGAGRGGRPVGADRARADAGRGRAADRAADRRRTGSGARPGHHPSRSQAGEHQGPPDGTVKVLDFGLAKALAPDGASATADAMHSPTLTARATQMGMIIGTAAYMSPEQARGKAVDRRADIWAFGVVVFEMLTGKRAFEGDEISDTLASVLKSDPNWSAIPPDLPAPIRRLLRRCLEKEPRKRLSAIGDARLELDDNEPVAHRGDVPSRLPGAHPGCRASGRRRRPSSSPRWPRGPHGPRRSSAPDVPLARLSVLAPPGTVIYPDSSMVAISPDGTMAAFIVGSVSRSDTQLWVRSLESTVARRLEAADGALLPFWSPDSRRIGFFTNSKLKTIAATGGRAETLCDATGARGGAWSPSNVIVFAPDAGGPLFRIPASGGTPTPVTTLDETRKEYRPSLPSLSSRWQPLPVRGAPGQGRQVRHQCRLACRFVAHDDRVHGQRACIRGPWVAALRPAGSAGRAALRRATP